MMGGGDEEGEDGDQENQVPEILPPGVQSEQEPKSAALRERIRQSGTGKKIHLPPFFQRTPAKRYMVAELEGPIDRLRMINFVMPGRRPENVPAVEGYQVVADPERGFLK